MTLQSFLGPWPLFQFLNLCTVGRTLWTGDQPVARPLPTHRKTQLTDIPTLTGIQTHDPSFRASEGSSCFRPRGHCELLNLISLNINKGSGSLKYA
jgi:hypothetical protein